MINKKVDYSEFLRAYRRNLIKHPNLICYYYYNHFWFHTQKMIWTIDVPHDLKVSLSMQIEKIGTLREEKDR